jgi:4-alpha-glucanotransferase
LRTGHVAGARHVCADPGRSSPYSPSSRLFLNALLVDPAAILGEAAQAQVLAEGDRR